MINPLKPIAIEVDKLADAIQTRVEIALITEGTKFNLSRLLTLDSNAERQAKYKSALEALN